MSTTARLGGPKTIPLSFAEAEAAAATPSVRRIMVAAMLLLFVGCGGLLFWAAITPIEQAVVARGSLVAEGRRKSILLSEPGILQQLLVREGQRVETGQVLLRLDPTVAEATAAQARAQALTVGAKLARLRAEQADQRAFAPPPELLAAARGDAALAAILAAETRLFTARWETFDGNVAVAQRRTGVERERLVAASAQRVSANSRLGSLRADIAGLRPVKINTVLMRGVNDHEAVPLLTWALEHAYELRFIEQMPLGPAEAWHLADMVTADEILAALRSAFTLTDSTPTSRGAAPAQTWLVERGASGTAGALRGTVGIVASVTRPFCGDCDRVRLTADGWLRDCLFAQGETDLIGQLRSGATDGELADTWRRAMWEKLPRHRIALPGFVQPDRPMSAIGG